jgi:hypothetical protein
MSFSSIAREHYSMARTVLAAALGKFLTNINTPSGQWRKKKAVGVQRLSKDRRMVAAEEKR